MFWAGGHTNYRWISLLQAIERHTQHPEIRKLINNIIVGTRRGIRGLTSTTNVRVGGDFMREQEHSSGFSRTVSALKSFFTTMKIFIHEGALARFMSPMRKVWSWLFDFGGGTVIREHGSRLAHTTDDDRMVAAMLRVLEESHYLRRDSTRKTIVPLPISRKRNTISKGALGWYEKGVAALVKGAKALIECNCIPEGHPLLRIYMTDAEHRPQNAAEFRIAVLLLQDERVVIMSSFSAYTLQHLPDMDWLPSDDMDKCELVELKANFKWLKTTIPEYELIRDKGWDALQASRGHRKLTAYPSAAPTAAPDAGGGRRRRRRLDDASDDARAADWVDDGDDGDTTCEVGGDGEYDPSDDLELVQAHPLFSSYREADAGDGSVV